MAALRDGGDDEDELHHGKAVPDALTRTAAKREECERRALTLTIHVEAVGVEILGILPEPRVAMGDIWAQQHDRAGRNTVPTDDVLFDGTP